MKKLIAFVAVAAIVAAGMIITPNMQKLRETGQHIQAAISSAPGIIEISEAEAGWGNGGGHHGGWGGKSHGKSDKGWGNHGSKKGDKWGGHDGKKSKKSRSDCKPNRPPPKHSGNGPPPKRSVCVRTVTLHYTGEEKWSDEYECWFYRHIDSNNNVRWFNRILTRL